MNEIWETVQRLLPGERCALIEVGVDPTSARMIDWLIARYLCETGAVWIELHRIEGAEPARWSMVAHRTKRPMPAAEDYEAFVGAGLMATLVPRHLTERYVYEPTYLAHAVGRRRKAAS
jgi:hypothetical protein